MEKTRREIFGYLRWTIRRPSKNGRQLTQVVESVLVTPAALVSIPAMFRELAGGTSLTIRIVATVVSTETVSVTDAAPPPESEGARGQLTRRCESCGRYRRKPIRC